MHASNSKGGIIPPRALAPGVAMLHEDIIVIEHAAAYPGATESGAAAAAAAAPKMGRRKLDPGLKST